MAAQSQCARLSIFGKILRKTVVTLVSAIEIHGSRYQSVARALCRMSIHFCRVAIASNMNVQMTQISVLDGELQLAFHWSEG